VIGAVSAGSNKEDVDVLVVREPVLGVDVGIW
jgi:hypothetical protein